MGKSPPRKIGLDELAYKPRFAFGEQCSIAVVSGTDSGGELGTGFARFLNASIPWTTRYDEVLLVLEGELTVLIGAESHRLAKHDCLWIPEGTALTYEATDALAYYAIHPVDWK